MKHILYVDRLRLASAESLLLDDISFYVDRGEIFALVGASGSGKSLTSLAIMRLLPEAVRVCSGDVALFGDSLFALPEREMRKVRGKRIAMIFQEPMSALNPVMPVGKQVEEVLRIHLGLSGKRAKEKVVSLFDEVGLPDAHIRYGWYPHQLSGGQKQRVMIAMALACEPELLIADEPTTALDVTIQAQVLTLLKDIRERRGLSILFITHDMAVVAEIADRIAVIHEGQIIETAQTDTFFKAPQHPYSRALLKNAQCRGERKIQKSSDTILEVEDLRVFFSEKRGLFQTKKRVTKAVDGVSFSIGKAETVALVGESGSGKSTIGQAILSLVPLSGGAVRFKGVDLSQLSERALRPYRKKIQIVFQDPFSSLNPRMRVGQIILEGMENSSGKMQSKAEQHTYMQSLLEAVEMDPSCVDRYPHEFSGGQRQRIAIARALAVSPELIICDEPTSALDVTVRAQILQLLQKIQNQMGISYLFITHDLSIVPTIADRVVVLREGKIIEQGDTAKVMQQPAMPYTKALLTAAPKLPDTIEREKL